jgi:hypothetical protein
MAQIREVKLIDDLDGGSADETVQFRVDGKDYEIDLSDTNAKEFRDAFAPYVAAARRLTGKQRPVQPAGTGRARVDREQTRAIREWARNNGHEISDRGRIPEKVLILFRAAH